MTIAQKFSAFLVKKRLTKADAARAMDVHYRIVWYWANGEGSGKISAASAEKISRFMGITVSELYK